MQTSTKEQSGASGLPSGDLLTVRAVNNAFYELRKQFEAIGVNLPNAFIIWCHKLNEQDTERLRTAMAGSATKSDADLLDKVRATLKQMERGHIKSAA